MTLHRLIILLSICPLLNGIVFGGVNGVVSGGVTELLKFIEKIWNDSK